MKTKLWVIGLLSICGVASCGDTLGQQLLTGGAIGGGTAVVANASLFPGIVVGAAVGAAYCQTYPGDRLC